jgi:Membrane bound O-acyl transferase family
MLGVCSYNVFRFHLTLIKPDSRVWHQVLRRSLTSNSNFLASTFRLPKSTFTTYFKLFTSFLISGLVHASADYILLQNFSGGSVQFYVLQAVAITFEDAVIAIASRLGYKQCKTFKLIGFIWVFAWFTLSLPMPMDPQVHAGAAIGR